MEGLLFEDVRRVLKPRRVIGKGNGEVRGISIDSRTVKPGELFFAIRGDRFDAHDFIGEVVKKGAGGVVFSRENAFAPANGETGFCVADTLRALQETAQFYRRKFPVKMVGVTGSNGKTTTKEFIAQLCGKFWETLKTDGTKNNHIGVPLTLFGLEKRHRVAVVEMGMSALGEIARLAEIAQPDVAVVTAVAPSHLEFLKTLENVYRAKLELVQALRCADSLAVLNADDPNVARMANETKARVVTFGFKESADYRASNLKSFPDGTIGFELQVSQEKVALPVRLNLLGRHNVLNCLAALAVTHQLGGGLDPMAKACAQLALPSMRMQRQQVNGILFLNDAYNANPKSMEVALKVLEDLEVEGKKIFVCGDMLELGLHGDEAHQELGKKIYDARVDVLITYGDLSRETAKKAIERGMDQDNVFVCTEKNNISELLRIVAQPGDVVLVKGSRRNQLEVILDEMRK